MIENNKKCDACLKEIKSKEPCFGCYIDQDQKLEDFIAQKKGKRHQTDSYLFCPSCQKDWKIFQLKNKKEELKKTKCDFCQKFLLGKTDLATLYYEIYTLPPMTENDSNKIIDKTACAKCWERNKWQYYPERIFLEMIVNPDRILGIEWYGKEKSRVIDLGWN